MVAGVAALIGGVMVSYFSFTALFLAMGAIDSLAIIVAWRGNLQSDVPSEQPLEASSTSPR